MNPYLKLGGRLVGVLMFTLGVALMAAAVWLVVEAVPYTMSRG